MNIIYYFILLLLIVTSKVIYSQDSDKVVILSDRVGPVIDIQEQKYFKVFEKYKEFYQAIVYVTPENIYYIRFTFLKSDGTKQDTCLFTSNQSVNYIAQRIDHYEDLRDGKYKMWDIPNKLKTTDGNELKIVMQNAKVVQQNQIKELIPNLHNDNELQLSEKDINYSRYAKIFI